MVLAVTPGAVVPPLLPVNSGSHGGAYGDHGTWRTPGPHFTPLRAMSLAAVADVPAPGAPDEVLPAAAVAACPEPLEVPPLEAPMPGRRALLTGSRLVGAWATRARRTAMTARNGT